MQPGWAQASSTDLLPPCKSWTSGSSHIHTQCRLFTNLSSQPPGLVYEIVIAHDARYLPLHVCHTKDFLFLKRCNPNSNWMVTGLRGQAVQNLNQDGQEIQRAENSTKLPTHRHPLRFMPNPGPTACHSQRGSRRSCPSRGKSQTSAPGSALPKRRLSSVSFMS